MPQINLELMLNYCQIPILLTLDHEQIVTVLTIVVIFFAVLLVLGIRKSYKLKKENERLDKLSEKLAKEEKEKYTDFTDGHMYQ